MTKLRVATTDQDREAMRLIRNECREFMTRDTSIIDEARQLVWWSKLAENRTVPYVLELPLGVLAGYGLLRIIAQRVWISGGLGMEYRGRGLGVPLFQGLLKEAGDPCWLEVRANNAPARAIYTNLGFQVTSTADNIITMATGVVVTPTWAPASLPEADYPKPIERDLLKPYRRPRTS